MHQFRIALQSLRTNRVRTMLTTLGIVIGVASVTVVLSLGHGIENTVRTQVSSLDNNIMLVSSGADMSALDAMRRMSPYGVGTTTSLTEQDYTAVRNTAGIDKIAPIMILNGTITAHGGTKNVPIIATSPELAHMLGLTSDPGQFIDTTATRDTAVVGSKLASSLFGGTQLLGNEFTLKGRPHTVVGVLKEINNPVNLSGIDLDYAVFISFDDGKSYNQGVAQIQQFIITVKDPSTLSSIRQQVDQTILNNHKGERDFAIYTGQHIADHNNSAFQAIVFMTAMVATITLIVGGIGIMNIMLVGVSERTREIGIRKALGATNSHILGQFLIEALIMCVVGGIVGLAIGYGSAFTIALQLGFQPAFTWQITLIGLGMAFITGIIFGLYPAVKAARKDPIESLRQYH